MAKLVIVCAGVVISRIAKEWSPSKYKVHSLSIEREAGDCQGEWLQISPVNESVVVVVFGGGRRSSTQWLTDGSHHRRTIIFAILWLTFYDYSVLLCSNNMNEPRTGGYLASNQHNTAQPGPLYLSPWRIVCIRNTYCGCLGDNHDDDDSPADNYMVRCTKLNTRDLYQSNI